MCVLVIAILTWEMTVLQSRQGLKIRTKGSLAKISRSQIAMVHGHGGVVLGSEMSGSIRNITISNCIFQKLIEEYD